MKHYVIESLPDRSNDFVSASGFYVDDGCLIFFVDDSGFNVPTVAYGKGAWHSVEPNQDKQEE